METFTDPREFVKNPSYSLKRRQALAALDLATIDEPLVDIVAGIATLPHCFTQQCCCGHFLCTPEQDPHSLAPILPDFAGPMRYRIAYIALGLANNRPGRGGDHRGSRNAVTAPSARRRWHPQTTASSPSPASLSCAACAAKAKSSESRSRQGNQREDKEKSPRRNRSHPISMEQQS